MKKYLVPLGLAAVLVLAVSGCRSSGTAFNPPSGRLATRHMYLSYDVDAGSMTVYTLPVTSSSVPTGTVTGLGDPREIYADAKGRVFVPLDDDGHDGVTVDVFQSPVTSSSLPAYTLTTTHAEIEDVAEDATGSLYVSSDAGTTCCIDVFTGPVSGTRAAPSFTIDANGVSPNGLGDPYGLTFDSSNDLYVSSDDSIIEYTPPITTASTPAANVTPNQNNYGILVDSSGRVFVANATANGDVAVFTQPFTNASSPAFNITLTGVSIYGMAFDASGNLWAVDAGGNLWEVSAPISASSTGAVILTGLTSAYGIAFGP